MTLRTQFVDQMKASMKAGDPARTSSLRMIMAKQNSKSRCLADGHVSGLLWFSRGLDLARIALWRMRSFCRANLKE